MSLSKRRVTSNRHGEPVLTITVTGHHDLYRLARLLQHGQVDLAELGRKIRDSQRRLLGPDGWASLTGHMGDEPPELEIRRLQAAAREHEALQADLVELIQRIEHELTGDGTSPAAVEEALTGARRLTEVGCA